MEIELFACLNVTLILFSDGIHLSMAVSLSQKEPRTVLYSSFNDVIDIRK
jgi:hypothetical protein